MGEDEVQALIDLIDWRRRVGDLYRIGGSDAITEFRRDRDALFEHHPQSPIEAGSADVVVDFNYAYNPSCVYSPRWACPLAPRENTLPVAVRAGERMPY